MGKENSGSVKIRNGRVMRKKERSDLKGENSSFSPDRSLPNINQT